MARRILLRYLLILLLLLPCALAVDVSIEIKETELSNGDILVQSILLVDAKEDPTDYLDVVTVSTDTPGLGVLQIAEPIRVDAGTYLEKVIDSYVVDENSYSGTYFVRAISNEGYFDISTSKELVGSYKDYDYSVSLLVNGKENYWGVVGDTLKVILEKPSDLNANVVLKNLDTGKTISGTTFSLSEEGVYSLQISFSGEQYESNYLEKDFYVFDKNTLDLILNAPICGDGICEASEENSCYFDCDEDAVDSYESEVQKGIDVDDEQDPIIDEPNKETTSNQFDTNNDQESVDEGLSFEVKLVFAILVILILLIIILIHHRHKKFSN